MEYGSKVIPTEIRQINEEKKVVITWGDGETFETSFEFLRVFCPCAGCKGHHPSQAKLIDGKRDVGITGIEPVGSYAIKINFSDGHDTGLFTWDNLYDMGKNAGDYWAEYLGMLEAAGKNRDVDSSPPPPSACSTGGGGGGCGGH